MGLSLNLNLDLSLKTDKLPNLNKNSLYSGDVNKINKKSDKFI